MIDWIAKLLGKYHPAEPDAQESPKEKEPPKPWDADCPDDWEPKTSDWRRFTRCHCGYRGRGQQKDSITLWGTICPMCGHEDKWETFTGRAEYEFSPSRVKLAYFWDAYARNEKIIRWTPDHCTVTEGENV